MSTRAKVTRVYVEVTYPDGERKLIDVDPEEHEALFWSDRAVNEMLAPFYKKSKQPEKGLLLTDLEETIGEKISSITPETVNKLWNTKTDKKGKDGGPPAVILKPRKCIPTVRCKRCWY